MSERNENIGRKTDAKMRRNREFKRRENLRTHTEAKRQIVKEKYSKGKEGQTEG